MSLFDFLHGLECTSTLFLVGILTFLGSKIAGVRPGLYNWGLRLAYGTLLVYLVAGFVYLSPSNAEEFVVLTLRGLLVAGLVLGSAWVILPAVATIYEYTVTIPLQKLKRWSDAADARAQDRKEQRQREAARLEADEEYERTRPERERQQREAADRAAVEAAVKDAAQKRRIDARARCSLAYGSCAHAIENRYTRKMYDEYVSTYLNDTFSPDDVERRASDLIGIIEQHQEAIKPTPKARSVAEIAEWFLAEKERIAALPLDDDTKDVHIMILERRYAELTEELLQKMKP